MENQLDRGQTQRETALCTGEGGMARRGVVCSLGCTLLRVQKHGLRAGVARKALNARRHQLC